MRRPPPLDLDGAERIAIRALGFLAGDPERLGRFLTLTGIGPSELREQAGRPEMLAAVLDHVLGDESMLLVFATEAGIAPDQVAPAAHLLSGAAGGAVRR